MQTHISEDDQSMQTLPLLKDVRPVITSPSLRDHLMTCWNVRENAKVLFKGNPTRYGELDGIRALSCLWVILYHTYYVYPDAVPVLNDFLYRFVKNGSYGVDSFFVLSGYLIYHILSKEYTTNGKINVLHFYLRRLLRLAPAYYNCIAIYWAATSKVIPSESEKCKQFWWSNLLFFNNFVWGDSQCAVWMWSVAAEMQFYIISPVFMALVRWRRTTGKIILWGIVVLSTLYRLLLALILEATVGSTTDQYFQLTCLTPWGRIAPFLLGMIVSMNIEAVGNGHSWGFNPRENQSWTTRVVFWLSMIVLFIAGGIWANQNIHDPVWSTASALVFGPLVVGLCVAYIIYYLQVYATESNYIKRFLSWRVFGIIAQLSYGMYLTAPIIQFLYYSPIEGWEVIHFAYMMGMFIFFSVLSFIAALLLYFLIEKPMMLIVR